MGHGLGFDLRYLPLWLAVIIEAFAFTLIPIVILRRKEPSSTAAWILALLFLPGLGATLFLLFGRDRVRLPAQWKRDADRSLLMRRSLPDVTAHETTLLRLQEPVDRELFRISAVLGGGGPSPGNRVELLVDGDPTYAAMATAIEEAVHHVHAEYYLVRRGATADRFRDLLIGAAGRGVAVRLLLDGYGSFWVTDRWLKPLRAAGVEVAFFLPARLLLLQPMNLRNHRKILVVDGHTGFTGGINIGDEYRGLEGPWRDAHLRLVGPAVQRLADVFAQDWHFATRRALPTGTYDRCGARMSRPDEHGDAMVAIVRSGPDVAGNARETIHRLFFSAITVARASVYITTPYFIPDRAIVVALQTAALRGVDVRLLLPSRSNHKVVFQAGRSFYEELLDAGVRIFEYGPGMIHAKTMVVDGSVALVGSANMDVRSFRLNFEVHAVIRDTATAARLEECFVADVARSIEIELESFRTRPRLLRTAEGAARLLSPLM